MLGWVGGRERLVTPLVDDVEGMGLRLDVQFELAAFIALDGRSSLDQSSSRTLPVSQIRGRMFLTGHMSTLPTTQLGQPARVTSGSQRRRSSLRVMLGRWGQATGVGDGRYVPVPRTGHATTSAPTDEFVSPAAHPGVSAR